MAIYTSFEVTSDGVIRGVETRNNISKLSILKRKPLNTVWSRKRRFISLDGVSISYPHDRA